MKNLLFAYWRKKKILSENSERSIQRREWVERKN